MKEEIKFGGRYFTIKRVKENSCDIIYIGVSDTAEMLRELSVDDRLIKSRLYQYTNKRQYARAINMLAYLLVYKMKNMGMTNYLKFQYPEQWAETDNDITFEHYVKCGNMTKTLKFDKKKDGLSELFIKMFIRYYNQIDYKKDYFKPKGRKAKIHW